VPSLQAVLRCGRRYRRYRRQQPACCAQAGHAPDAGFVVFEVAAGPAHQALEAGKGQGIILVKQLHKNRRQVGPAGETERQGGERREAEV
jgi:hypothetical protein